LSSQEGRGGARPFGSRFGISSETMRMMKGLSDWDAEVFRLSGVSYEIETELGFSVWLVPSRSEVPTSRIEVTPEDLIQLSPQAVLRMVYHLHSALSFLGGGRIERLTSEGVADHEPVAADQGTFF
jgi:hypothetical protein